MQVYDDISSIAKFLFSKLIAMVSSGNRKMKQVTSIK